MIEMAMINVQRVITLYVDKPELRFMCSAHRLIVLYIIVKFSENITNGIRVMERTRNYDALTDGQTDRWTNIQNFVWYNIIPRQFLWRGIKSSITEGTQVPGSNGYVQFPKGNNSKSRQTRVTVHKFCMLSHEALNV